MISKKKVGLTRRSLLMLLIFFSSIMLARAAEQYRVNEGQSVTINEWSKCRKVVNSSGKNLFVPTKTAAEWDKFIETYEDSLTVVLASCDTECRLSNNLYHKSWIHNHPSEDQDTVCTNDFGAGWTALRNPRGGDPSLSYLWTVLKDGDATVCYDDWSATGPHGYNYKAYVYGQTRLHLWGKDSYCDSDCWSRTGPEPAFCDRNESCTGNVWCAQTDGWGGYYNDDIADRFVATSPCGGAWVAYDCNRDPNLSHIICCRQ